MQISTGDGKLEEVIFKPATRETAVIYLNGAASTGQANGPTLPVGWTLVGCADFNKDGKPDQVLLNVNTGATQIWHLSGVTLLNVASEPVVPEDCEVIVH